MQLTGERAQRLHLDPSFSAAERIRGRQWMSAKQRRLHETADLPMDTCVYSQLARV